RVTGGLVELVVIFEADRAGAHVRAETVAGDAKVFRAENVEPINVGKLRPVRVGVDPVHELLEYLPGRGQAVVGTDRRGHPLVAQLEDRVDETGRTDERLNDANRG